MIMNHASTPRGVPSESQPQLHIDVEDEERRLMQGARNNENKDDFWISLSQQLLDEPQTSKTMVTASEV